MDKYVNDLVEFMEGLGDKYTARGAAAERERIRAAVEKLANVPPNPSISWGEGYIRAIRKVLALLKN